MSISSISEKLDQQATDHTEKAFIVKSLLMVLSLMVLRSFLGSLFLPILSFAFFNYFIYLWINTNKGVWGIFQEQISLIPAPQVTEKDRRKEAAWATWGLILVNSFMFYFVQTEDNKTFLDNYLIFVPDEANILTVPLSLFSSMYLHNGFQHLYGNMCFLWATGTIVERRIGWKRFLLFYNIAGLVGGILSYTVYVGGLSENLKMVGASGAIAGVMGIFIIRCYFKKMTLPIPAFGFLPFNFNLQMNGLVVVGMFFSLDLRGGLLQLLGLSQSQTGHWDHVGGIITGICLAWRFKLGENAVEERHRDIGNAVFDGRNVETNGFYEAGGFAGTRKSLLIALEKDPNNSETLIALARVESHFEATPEGLEYYKKAISILMKTSPDEAVTTFEEYYPRYRIRLDTENHYRIATLLHKKGNYEIAERSFMQLVDCSDVSREMKERSLFYSARILEQMGLPDPARRNYLRFMEEYPESQRADVVVARLPLLSQAETLDVPALVEWR